MKKIQSQSATEISAPLIHSMALLYRKVGLKYPVTNRGTSIHAIYSRK
jgi:hypothetical protein